ncbi:unnamed protein product [Paramecium octaurelia]|uniref:ADP/ATP translocase n=1 Tax=Paramecium octaurelia TaxID=43137 RepID=A0A8S1XI07_PAROT|nr:unnamed protein product [Paramecium octaurelia]
MTDFLQNFLIGGVSAACSKTAFAPFERVKLLLQTQDAIQKVQNGQTKRYNGILDCFSRISKEEGLSAFWRGNFANIIRFFPAQALSFALKDTYKYMFNQYDQKKQPIRFFISNIAAGSAAGATSLLLVYPLDFARTRLAVDIGKQADRQFTGLTDCLTKIYRLDGFIGLYRGFGVTVFGVMVYRAIYFGAYDTALKMFNHQNHIFYLFLLAQFVACTASILSYPLDTIRRRMMMQSGRVDVLYGNSFDCCFKIIKNEGMRGFFKGFLLEFSSKLGFSLMLAFYSSIQSHTNLN